MPDRIHITNMIVDDEKSAQPCGHCTFPECQARASCELSWQPDHVLITCFRKNVHHHQVLLRSDRRPAQDIAATVSHNFPLRASATLLGRKPALFQCDQPTDKEHRQARWRFLQKQLARKVATSDGALAWQERLAERVAFNPQQMCDGLMFYPLCAKDATWLPLQAFTQVSEMTVPLGSCLFMSRYMVEATRAYVAAGGVRSLKQGVLLGDFSWKFCCNGYAVGLWAQAAQHSYSLGTSSQHLPKSEAIPAAYQWAPKENIPAVALGLVTMISVYLKVFNIDLTTWFSAVILDGHAAGQATVEMVLRPGTLLGRDLPHLERNILKNFPHADDTRSKRKGRRPRPGSQEEGSAGVCNEEQSSATVQAAYSKANLRLVSLCCPTPLLQSIAMETVMAHDMFRGLDHLVMYWQHQLAKRHNDTGLRKPVGSTDLMSEFVPGFTPGSCFQAGERCNRSLMKGMPSTAHKACIDEAIDFLKARSPLASFGPCSWFSSHDLLHIMHVFVVVVQILLS